MRLSYFFLVQSVTATASQQAYAREGFLIMPSLMSDSDVSLVTNQIDSHIRSRSHDYRLMMGGNQSGGWYIADFPSVPALSSILNLLQSKPRLADLLDDLLGAGEHRLLARSEIYSDRTNVWHSDALYGHLALYNNELPSVRRSCLRRPRQRMCREGGDPFMPFWQRDEHNETHQIVTVAIYLQDHMQNTHGLSVKPRTHTDEKLHHRFFRGAITKVVEDGSRDDIDTKLHYRAGDAVVFDCRLLHRGVQHRFANHAGDVAGAHRSTSPRGHPFPSPLHPVGSACMESQHALGAHQEPTAAGRSYG